MASTMHEDVGRKGREQRCVKGRDVRKFCFLNEYTIESMVYYLHNYSKYGKRQELDWLLELTRNSEIF